MANKDKNQVKAKGFGPDEFNAVECAIGVAAGRMHFIADALEMALGRIHEGEDGFLRAQEGIETAIDLLNVTERELSRSVDEAYESIGR